MADVLGWHWLREDRRLAYHPHKLVEVGQTLRVEPPIVLCKNGLHGSRLALDALQYAPGPILCRTLHGGEIVECDDKLASSERTCVAMADASVMLHTFACDEAERALRTAKVDDPRSWAAIETKRRWLRGEATGAELAAARAAAWAAAKAAAWAAAWEVAWAAAKEVALEAAREAAWEAARAATWEVAWAAAREAAREAARAAARAAAWEAAREAAWEAAWEAQNARLEHACAKLLALGEHA